MRAPWPQRIASGAVPAIPLLLVALLLLALRSGQRILHPEIWAEDADNLFAWVQYGLASVAHPVNGYLIVVPRLITNLAASLSIYYYPLISSLLAWGVALFVVLAVARSPLHLKGGALLGIACLLVPTGMEVFGLPLLTFWWTSLLLFVAVFWDQDARTAAWARTICVGLAALSSPVSVVVAPLLVLRAWLLRDRPAEVLVAMVGAAGAAIQLALMWRAGQGSVAGMALAAGGGGAGIRLELETAVLVVRKFLGAWLIGNLQPKAIGTFGWLLLALCAVAAWRHRRSPVVWALAYLWGATVMIACLRVDIRTLHQELAGARYFFLPHILLSWFLLHVALQDHDRRLRRALAGCLVLSVINMLPVLRNSHDDLRYQERLEACGRGSGTHMLYAHNDGYGPHAWGRWVASDWCAAALESDRLYQWLRKR
jgi:hypothetical protein